MNVPFFDIKQQNLKVADETANVIKDIIINSAFVGGTHVSSFEEKIKNYLGVGYAVSCGNGTDALTMALRACNVQPGDEVITTSFTFFATAEAICSVGAKPVFVDVHPLSYLMDETKIESCITPKTKAILPVQIFGACADMDTIMEIARKYDLKVIEDDAQAIGSEYNGKKAGSLADVGCFSFYPTKNLGGFGDGGMCVTNDEVIYTRLRALAEHGAGENGAKAAKSLGLETTHKSTGEAKTENYNPDKYYNYLIGYNSRLDAIQAAALSVKMDHLADYNARRAEIAEIYSAYLSDRIITPVYSHKTKCCWHQYGVLVPDKAKFQKWMEDHGIGTGNFYPVPMHKQKAFNEENCANYGITLPVVEELCEHIVCLPVFPELTDDQVLYVIQTANQFFNEEESMKPFVHTTAEVSEKALVGKGTKIWNQAQIRENVSIGEGCVIGKNVYIDDQVVIGDRVKVQNNVNVYKGVVIEDDVFVGPSATFTNDMYPRSFSKEWEVVPTLVKKGASIGANSTIRCGVTIGEYAMIGAGSVVTNDVPSHALVIGNPAREVGYVCKCGHKVSIGESCSFCGEHFENEV